MSQRFQIQTLQQRLTSTGVSEDLAYGQYVIIAARWILVLAGLVLTLWLPGAIADLRVQIMTLLLLAVVNFYLHAQLLMRRPTADAIAYLASAADLVVITLLVMQGGPSGSNLYIFYFPAIVALSVAFPTELVLSYTGTTILVYASVYIYDLDVEPTSAQGQVLVARLLMLAAVAVCGNVYWRIEHRRRRGIRGVLDVQDIPDSEIGARRDPKRTPVGHATFVTWE
jgi:hypothetical protein